LLELMPHLREQAEIIPVAAFAEPNDLVAAYVAVGVRPMTLGGPGWMKRLRSFVDDQRIDIVHTHAPLVAGLARVALFGTRAAIVHTEHSLWSSYRRSTRVLNAATFFRNDAVTAVSEAVASEIEGSHWGRLGPRVRIIPNGVDIATVERDASFDIELDIRTPSYVCVSHLRRRKGIDVLLDASARVANAIPAARGFVVGEGEDAEMMRERQRAVGQTVTLLGRRSDARAIMARGDIYVLPSRIEGLPLALLEAMILRKPIVATRIGSIPNLLTDGVDSLLVQPEDPEALASAIVRLLRDPGLAAQLGARARARIEQRPGVTEAAAAYLDTYDEAVRRKNGSTNTSESRLSPPI
jgi:glycosyltransferase involved in cell wall biosynthesis